MIYVITFLLTKEDFLITNNSPHRSRWKNTYKYDICDNTFRQKSALIVYKRIHDEEEPHKCSINLWQCLYNKTTIKRSFNHSLWWQICKCNFCSRAFIRQKLWRIIWKFTQEKTHIHVIYVIKSLLFNPMLFERTYDGHTD